MASWAVIQWSRSEAALISSAVLPVLSARISIQVCFLIRRKCSTSISMSVTLPLVPAEG